uniref:PPIase cyclophilin-type domain-containing protein n=1 Tax=Sphenodon punctatus TaxID=8508 RepID=A0A8D0HN18_SPHPU
MAVTLHTDVGDIKIEIFCERAPKACENFLEATAFGERNLMKSTVNTLNTMSMELFPWQTTAQTPMDLSSSSPTASSPI